MGILDSARAMGMRGLTGASKGLNWMSGTSMAQRAGMMAGGGALYGATVGRDPGQGYLGGAMSGAAGGLALGAGARYGKFAYNAMGRSGGLRAAAMGRRPGAFASAGRATYGMMKRDARSARSYIGNAGVSANAGWNKFRALGR